MVSLLTRLATGVVAVACRVPTPGRVLVGLAVVVLLPLGGLWVRGRRSVSRFFGD